MTDRYIERNRSLCYRLKSVCLYFSRTRGLAGRKDGGTVVRTRLDDLIHRERASERECTFVYRGRLIVGGRLVSTSPLRSTLVRFDGWVFSYTIYLPKRKFGGSKSHQTMCRFLLF